MNHAKTASKLREQMARFSGKVAAGLPKVARRLVREVLYGIQARGSVRLSEIARALKETTASKKVIERLGRQLGRPGLRDQIFDNLLRLAVPHIGEETLLVLDPADITKPHARKMEHLAKVRDGSEGELSQGYWCLEVVAARRASAEVIPLFQELYSQEAPDFVSENDEILAAIERVSKALNNRGIWVIDRGGDRARILESLLDSGRSFIIRQRGDRHLTWRRSQHSVVSIAQRCRCRYRQRFVRQHGHEERILDLRMGSTPVKWKNGEPLTLVIVEGLGKKPLLLLTTLKVGRSQRSHWRIVESYLARWRVEETIRFLKQSYQLEDIRLLRYERLRNMVALVLATAYFSAVHLGRETKLQIFAQHLLQASERIYGVPEFRLYALADGIKELLFGSQQGIQPSPPRPPDPNLSLPGMA